MIAKGAIVRYDNIVALLCVTSIVMLALWLQIEGAKELALALGGGISGWMTGGAIRKREDDIDKR